MYKKSASIIVLRLISYFLYMLLAVVFNSIFLNSDFMINFNKGDIALTSFIEYKHESQIFNINFFTFHVFFFIQSR